MVWTSDGRQFFFDVTSRVSLWMIPEELKDNPQVEKIIEGGPEGQGGAQYNIPTHTGSFVLCLSVLAPPGTKGDAPSAKRVKLSEEGEGEEEEMEEGGGGLDISVGGQAVATVSTVPTEAVDAEKTATMMRLGKTFEERQEEFKEMLLERGVRETGHSFTLCAYTHSLLCIDAGVCLLYLGQGAAQVCV